MPDSEKTQTSLLDLSAPERIVRLRIAGREALHVFRPLTLDDWVEFIKGSRAELVQSAEGWSAADRAEEAACALWDRAIVRVTGYKGDDWKVRMPAAHKVAAVSLLQEVYALPSEADPFDLDPESVTVKLEAAWNLEVFPRLLHRFRPPRAEHLLRFKRLQAGFFRVAGRRQQSETRVLVPVRLRGHCELWDELITGVEGYALPSESLGGIQKAMCPLHKQTAVLALFQPAAAGEASE